MATNPQRYDPASVGAPTSTAPRRHTGDARHAERLDHTRAPLLEALLAYRDADMTSFTIPGHKRGRGVEAELAATLGRDAFRDDIPLAGGADDLRMTSGVLEQAQRLAADAFGAQRSFFLVNGSTSSNQVALLSVAGPGEEIVMARNAHKSMQAALIMGGARPVYVHPRYDAGLEIAHGVSPADLAATLDAHPNARAAVVVSPTYYGVASDLPALVDVCHERDVALIVDEAWAAHFPFHPALPPSAMAAGADAAITSIHKVLSGFSQSSLLNVQGERISATRMATWANLLQTTSPSALILASIDGCRRQMVLRGHLLLERTLALAARARTAVAEMPGLHVLGPEVLGQPGAAALDETKLVIDVGETGLTGYEADTWLREQRSVVVELSDHRRILALLTIGDDAESVGRLLDALHAFAAMAPGGKARARNATMDISMLQTEGVLTPRDAFFAPARRVPLERAVDAISAEMITPYPPGIPVVVPGERITRAIVDYLCASRASDMYVTGASDHSLATVRVVATR